MTVTLPWFVAALFFIAFGFAWLALDNRSSTARTDQIEDDLDRHIGDTNDRLERAEDWVLHLSGRARHLPAIDVGDPGVLPTTWPDATTDEIPVSADTVPDGLPLAVQAALIEQRPSPVARGKSAEWVEEQLTEIRARIDAAREAS